MTSSKTSGQDSLCHVKTLDYPVRSHHRRWESLIFGKSIRAVIIKVNMKAQRSSARQGTVRIVETLILDIRVGGMWEGGRSMKAVVMT